MRLRFTQVVPAPFNQDYFRLEMLNAADRIVRQIRRDFQTTTKTWTHKPIFSIERGFSASALRIEVWTNSVLYKWVDQGTPKQEIYPVDATVLRFPGVYRAKTYPGVIDSNEGGYEGEAIFSAYANIGYEGRGFTEIIRDNWESVLPALISNAMDDAARKTGYGL